MMDAAPFRMPRISPAQAASETDATIIEWLVAEGDHFRKGQALAEIQQREIGL